MLDGCRHLVDSLLKISWEFPKFNHEGRRKGGNLVCVCKCGCGNGFLCELCGIDFRKNTLGNPDFSLLVSLAEASRLSE